MCRLFASPYLGASAVTTDMILHRLVFSFSAMLTLVGCDHQSYAECVALGTSNSLAEAPSGESTVEITSIKHKCAVDHPAGAGDSRGEAPPNPSM